MSSYRCRCLVQRPTSLVLTNISASKFSIQGLRSPKDPTHKDVQLKGATDCGSLIFFGCRNFIQCGYNSLIFLAVHQCGYHSFLDTECGSLEPCVQPGHPTTSRLAQQTLLLCSEFHDAKHELQYVSACFSV